RIFTAYIRPAVAAAADPSYPEEKRRNMRAAIHLAEHLHEAPVLLFVAGWARRGAPPLPGPFPPLPNRPLPRPAVGPRPPLPTLHTALGREVDAWLGLPENCPTCAMLPIGWPRGRYSRPHRRPVDESLFWERFAEPTGDG